MNRRMVLYVLCLIMRVEAVLLVPPLVIALVQREEMAAFGFLVAIAALLGASPVSSTHLDVYKRQL